MLWYQRLGLSEDARAIIDRIRSSEPVRRVGGGKSNVCGRYPSRKMEKTIQFESHRLEFAVILEMEDDPAVFEYYDQPCKISLKYCTAADAKSARALRPTFSYCARIRRAGKSAKLTRICRNWRKRLPRATVGTLTGSGAVHRAKRTPRHWAFITRFALQVREIAFCCGISATWTTICVVN